MEVVNLNEIRPDRETHVAGRYSASLLGTIRSNLEGLQGYGVMALELIQNADDAGAEEMTFDVTDNVFDRNWRDVAVEEQADPAYAFQQGARIRHDTYGIGSSKGLSLGVA
jgi:hypothetical protein